MYGAVTAPCADARCNWKDQWKGELETSQSNFGGWQDIVNSWREDGGRWEWFAGLSSGNALDLPLLYLQIKHIHGPVPHTRTLSNTAYRQNTNTATQTLTLCLRHVSIFDRCFAARLTLVGPLDFQLLETMHFDDSSKGGRVCVKYVARMFFGVGPTLSLML